MASKYGVTPAGFVRPRLPEIKKEIETELAEAFGVPINTRPDSVIGQLIGVWSDREATLWETAENVYYAMYPHTAVGISLTNSVAFSGVRPISAEKTVLMETCYGTNNTTLPPGCQIKSNVDESITFSTANGGKISTNKASYADISLVSVAPDATYAVIIDGQNYSYVALVSDTATSILVSLAAQMVSIEGVASVSNSHLIIERTDQRGGYAISTSANLQVNEVGSPVEFLCDSYGAINPDIGTVTQIVTQVSGWNRCGNNAAAVVGRDDETETELRQRYGRSVYQNGSALIEAIAARIYEDVEGVTADIVFENDTDETDADGRPPHSIEAVVQGGDDVEIAKVIWKTKAPGISTAGDVAVEILDSQGVRHTINFNRPTLKKVWIKAVLEENQDEDFAADNPEQVKALILTKGQASTVGQDVILQRFLGPIYAGTSGIGNVTITAAVSDTPPAPGDYSLVNISIGTRELADFSAGRIEVAIA